MKSVCTTQMSGRSAAVCSTIASLMLLAALPAAALAGPDIVHSDLQDTARYGPVTAGGDTVYAYAWGSNTCNIGNQDLSWVNGGSPGLAMNAYRLDNGRLTQIGLGWVKHSCCVANGNGCGTGVVCSSTGSGLRVGCRDVYSAGFNGGQGRLGPRSGINAYDSTFAAIPAFSGDAVARRVRITSKDMSANDFPGAQYFAEGVYVCLEEVPAQALNNATYRQATVANTGASPTYAWSVAGTSRVGRPAIYAWQDHGLGANQPDLNVKITPVDIPGEGRLFVAGKVTTLAGGIYRYDYAIYNLNSHRSAAGITIPLPASATVTSSFSAPAYHSGEPYSNNPWIQQRSGDTVTQRVSQTFGENVNANAVRWGTMYNMSFQTTAAPAPSLGNVSVALFRPGAVGEPNSVEASGMPVPCVAPAITAPAPIVYGCRDQTVTLAATAAPSQFSHTYQWQIEDRLNLGSFINLTDTAGPCAISGTGTTSLSIGCASVTDDGRYQLVVTSACGNVTTTPTQLFVCVGDINCDGGADGADVETFFVAWENAQDLADVNADGGVDGSDVSYFFSKWAIGC